MPEPMTATAPAPAPTPAAKPAAPTPSTTAPKPSAAAELPKPEPAKTPPPKAPEKPAAPDPQDDEFDTLWDKLKTKQAPPKKDEPTSEDQTQEGAADAQKPASIASEPGEKSKTAPPKVEGIKAVRDQLEKVTSELKQERESHHQAKSRLAEIETKAKDATALAERLAAREKEIDELQSNLRALKQEASPEFVEKYDKPFNQAAELAQAEISQLAVINPETGEPVRKAEFQRDFAAIYNLEYIEAKARAKQLFGEDAQVVIEHYLALKRLDRARHSALTEERTKWTEKEKAQAAQAAQQREALQAAETKVRQELLTKHADWYGEDPEDTDGNTLLKEGEAFVNYKPQTFQQAVLWKTRLQLNAAAFPRELARNAKLREEVASLKAQLDELRNSAPGKQTGKPGGAEAPKREMSIVDELRANRDQFET